jgi:hypothetical protein
MKWACGVTTVPQRIESHLPRTLESLRAGGFEELRLFVDGAADAGTYRRFGLPGSFRVPGVGAYGNWLLALAELCVRCPEVDRYALFQDDLIMCRNVRQYLETVPYPEKGYLNLMTFMDNEQLTRRATGWHETPWRNPGSRKPPYQLGRSALALVFSNRAAAVLLGQSHMLERLKGQYRTFRIDGGVVEAMNGAGWKEFAHNPSLVSHTGRESTLHKKRWRLNAMSFRGEDFDALELLPCAAV